MSPDAARLAWSRADKVHGWFSFEAAMLLAWLDDFQKQLQVIGDLFEIGVHHGRSSVFLASMLDIGGEKLGVCDLFGRQVENVSASGSGDQAIFESNMSTHVAHGARIVIHPKASSELGAREIGSRHRLFHIDGGHTAAETLSDLRLAEATCVEGGLIVLDDAINPTWPGVAEGLFEYLRQTAAMRPVAIGFNKLVLADVRHASAYRERLGDGNARSAYGLGYPWHIKELAVADAPVTIFYIPSYVPKSRLARFAQRLRR